MEIVVDAFAHTYTHTQTNSLTSQQQISYMPTKWNCINWRVWFEPPKFCVHHDQIQNGMRFSCRFVGKYRRIGESEFACVWILCIEKAFEFRQIEWMFISKKLHYVASQIHMLIPCIALIKCNGSTNSLSRFSTRIRFYIFDSEWSEFNLHANEIICKWKWCNSFTAVSTRQTQFVSVKSHTQNENGTRKSYP